jgi:threonine dehydratase
MTVPPSIQIEAAERRLRPYILQTPLLAWPGTGVWLKCENEQLTGSFKLRGALNKVLSLAPPDLERGLVAASAGNHGIGVAFAVVVAGAQATVVVPRDIVERKRRALEAFGAEIRLADGDYAVAERDGLSVAALRRATWISPYNDPEVIAGQGTLGRELSRQIDNLHLPGEVDVYVPVSGGGLLAGVGLGLRQAKTRCRVFGVQTESAPYFHRFFHGQDPAEVKEVPTLADGLAGAVDAGSITWDLVLRVAEDILLVSETEIARALLRVFDETGMLIEPAAAVPVAACLAGSGTNRIALVSGGNADPDLIDRVRSR